MYSFSFLVATYNRLEYLKQSISSIIDICKEQDEIIISDDGSDQKTREYLINLASSHKNIKLFLHDNFGSIDKNMIYGLQKCSKDIIVICDSDDICLPNRREVISDLYINNPSIEVIYHNSKIIDEQSKITNEDFFITYNQRLDVKHCLFVTTFYGAMLTMRKEFIQKYLDQLIKSNQPWDRTIGFISLKAKTIFFENQKLVLYRRWHDNVSIKKKTSLITKIVIRLRRRSFYKKIKIKE